jgi:hypothetical protein
MENTGGVLFEQEASAEWYLAQGEGWVGPLTAGEIYEQIRAGTLSWAHFAWRNGQADWMRLSDIPIFQVALPSKPQVNLGARIAAEGVNDRAKPEVRKASLGRMGGEPPFAREERYWFLHYNDAQFGPFSFEEVCRFLRIGKIHGRVYAWKDGMVAWEKLEKLVAFAEAIAEGVSARSRIQAERPGSAPDSTGFVDRRKTPRVQELRQAPRYPLVARVLWVGEEADQIATGVCRDVSVGGMQILTDGVLAPLGSRIRLNVSPEPDQEKPKFKPFVASGQIVRILEDGRGFCFRFDRLRGDARRAIEEYVQAEDLELRQRSADEPREGGVLNVGS